ncbi:MAG: nucleoside monophosphate kinase, partial [Pseudomonadota bacterium]
MTGDRKAVVVAIDGPAASGKGTLSRELAARFNLAHLDTGSLYRAVAAKVLAAGQDPKDPITAVNRSSEAPAPPPQRRSGLSG